MSRTLCAGVIVFLCIFMQIQFGECNLTNKNSADEIRNVIKGAVEDTTWLRATTQKDLEQLLGAYYTWPALQGLIESTWNFVKVPTDWEYLVTTDNCEITHIFGKKANAQADILETDEITGITYLSKMEYSLVYTKKGWKISGIRTICP